MKKNIFTLLIVFMMIACVAPSQKSKSAQGSTVSAVNKKNAKVDSSKLSIQDRLCNITWENIDCLNEFIQFDKDSAHFFNEDPGEIVRSYTLSGNKMITHYDKDFDIIQEISFHKDTLLMKNEFGEITHMLSVKQDKL